jgi:hypothetical protein
MPDPRTSHPGLAEPRNPETAFEASDVRIGPIGLLAVGVILWLGLVPYFLSLGYPDATRDAFKAPTVVPPEPRQQTHPAQDLAAFRAAKHDLLTSYGWVDQAHGVVHIPIDEAMQKIAERGLPDWPGNDGAKVSKAASP